MRLLLPPSETKLKGGQPHKGLPTLSFPVQNRGRLDLLVTLESWCRDSPAEAAKALKLGPKSIEELANNQFVDAPLMPAIERYTGVLYSATGVADWTAEQRAWAAQNVFIHSSLFGIVSSADDIPVYRLSHDSKIRGIPLKDYWLGQVTEAIREMAAGDWILDCRSEGYRTLAPIPADVPSLYLDVVSANGGKALNHFNKIHKGELVCKLVESAPDISTPDALAGWGSSVGLTISITEGRARLAI